jgi:malate/lactate dehydrogenase
MFGPHQKVNLRLVECSKSFKLLETLAEDLEFMTYPCLKNVTLYHNEDQADSFKDTGLAILIDAPSVAYDTHKFDELKANGNFFQKQGEILNENAGENTRVLVVGNESSTNALVVAKFAPNLKRKNITALSRLNQKRTVNKLSEFTGTDPENISNVFVWGSNTEDMVPDFSLIKLPKEAAKKLNGDDFDRRQFVESVASRIHANAETENGYSTKFLLCTAICEHCHDWYNGTKDDEVVSMAVIPEESHYCVYKDICFSYPCRVDPLTGDW